MFGVKKNVICNYYGDQRAIAICKSCNLKKIGLISLTWYIELSSNNNYIYSKDKKSKRQIIFSNFNIYVH